MRGRRSDIWYGQVTFPSHILRRAPYTGETCREGKRRGSGHAPSSRGGDLTMRRLSLTRRGGAILVALALLVGLPAATGVAATTGSSPQGVAANAPGAALAPVALAVHAGDASSTDGSASPHFAFGRVLSQATATE